MSKTSEQTIKKKKKQMASKLMKTHSTPLVIREMHIKTTARAYSVPVTMSTLQRLTTTNVGEDREEPQVSYTAG